MELTKEQIQSIDNILKEKGVKFWDVRLEMIDHIANNIESNPVKEANFNSAIMNNMIQLGYNGNFEDLIQIKQKQIQKKFAKKNNKELFSFFKSYKTLIPYLLFIALGLTQLENNTFFKTIIIGPVIAVGIQLIFSLVNYTKVYKSIYLLSSTTGIFLATSLLNALIYIPKMFIGDFVTPNWYLLTISAITLPLIYTGLKVFIDTYKKYDFTTLKL